MLETFWPPMRRWQEKPLTITEALQNRDGKIRFIRSRQEGEFDVEMLRLLVKEEEEEIRIAPD
jgi:hypothetical protein